MQCLECTFVVGCSLPCFHYSLNETKKRVDMALADDFDTLRAVNAIEELVRRTNGELHEKKSKVTLFVYPFIHIIVKATF